MISKVDCQLFKTAGTPMEIIPSLAELSAHELIGHGLGREMFGEEAHQTFAIQMNNVYLRLLPIPE